MNHVVEDVGSAGKRASGAHAMAHVADAHGEGQQHPIRIYLVIWGLLFFFSICSYLVDYFDLQGTLRYGLIIFFMLLKAGFIIAIFMHMAWERLALKIAILVPPLALLVLIAFLLVEGDYTFMTRVSSFVTNVGQPGQAHPGAVQPPDPGGG